LYEGQGLRAFIQMFVALSTGSPAGRELIKRGRAVHRTRGEDASGECAGEAAHAGEAAPPAVRVTLKSGDAGAQWQRDLGGMAGTTGFGSVFVLWW
jgi:hypothetical protein